MIELDDVSYSYPQTGKGAVEHLSLSLSPGTCVLVTGPSGAGKTTLCFAASGILDHEYGGKIPGESVSPERTCGNIITWQRYPPR